MERVLVTGLGVVSSLGSGKDAFWRGLHTAPGRPERVRDPGAHMDLPLMYGVPAADSYCPDGAPRGRASRFAVEAARQAVADAGLPHASLPRLGVVIGTGMGDSEAHEQWRTGPGSARQPRVPACAIAGAVGDWLGGYGVSSSISNACAASGFALAVAADLIRCGEADVVVAGGAEGYSRVALGCFNRLGGIDPVRCRPFDRHRRGTVFGEGAAILVLESESHARERRAPTVYAHLAGSGWSCDAHHPTAPEPSGQQITRAMRQALREAGASPGSVGCVIPHGTGTELNDLVESHALHRIFGARLTDVPLFSLKALIGHTGGAAGALAALAAALILHHRAVPPNVPLDEQDPECEVWLPQGDGVPLAGAQALDSAYAFGGNNVSFLLERAVA